jgi:hypothetical protein
LPLKIIYAHRGQYTDATLQTIAAVSNVTDTLIVL